MLPTGKLTRACLAVGLLLAAGCDGEDPEMDAGPEPTDAGPMQMMDAGGVVDPVISNVLAAESPNSVLIYRVSFSTDIDAQGTVEVRPTGGDPWTVPGMTALGTDHEVLVLGLHAETEYTFGITATTPEGGSAMAESDPVTTAALPADLPPLDVTISEPGMVSPGYTVFGVRRWTPSQDTEWGYLLALDEAGEVVWYLDVGRPTGDLRMLENGELLFLYGDVGMTRVTMDGETVWDRQAPDVGTDTFHHEAFPMADGNLVVLSTELRSIGGYPGDVTYDVVGDTVAVLSGDGSTIMREHSLFDVLDPLRTRDGFDAPFWNERYSSQVASTKDWTHSNAVIEDPSDGNFIVSVRHQDWLIKIDSTTGDLIWRLGEGGDFTLDGVGEFQFHEHAPELQADGNLLVYDNGNARSTLGPGEAPYTRVVELALDETAMTVTQVWEYRGEAPYFSPFVGDADRLSNGNVLITDGGLIVGCPEVGDPTACAIGAPTTQKWSRLVEVTGAETPVEVMRVDVRDPATMEPTGYTIYRAERVDSLYGVTP